MSKDKSADNMGGVVATRVYRLGHKRIVVRIGRPQTDGSDWFCPYQIVGLGDEKVRRAWGVDSFQALQLVMQAVRAHLVPHASKLSLFGVKGETGISKLMPDCFTQEVNQKLESVVEAVLETLVAYGEAVGKSNRRRTTKGRRRPTRSK